MKIRVWPDGQWQEACEEPYSYKSDDYMILTVLDPVLEYDDALDIAISVFGKGYTHSKQELLDMSYEVYTTVCLQVFNWEHPKLWDEHKPDLHTDYITDQKLKLCTVQRTIKNFLNFMS